jgi:cobalamin biosynthetic protein CobC
MSEHPDSRTLPHHGGDLTFATQRHGVPAGGWLDLSTGINPTAYPAQNAAPEALARLPDKAALARLIATARRAYAVPDGVDLVAVPGTEIAIRLIPFLAPPGAVAIVGPTYASHAEAWRNTGRVVAEAASLAVLPADAAIVALANPNNPDGRTASRNDLAGLARRVDLLIVDEAFADATPEMSFIPVMTRTHAIVLRSLGKFYGLPGLRLGFVAAPPAFAQRLAATLGDWPVSGPALTIGEAALSDDAWRDATRARLRHEAAALRALLAGHGLSIVGGTDLFVLVETADAHVLHRALAEHGIWTRAFADHPHWLRFGLPGDIGMDRLAAALSAFG